MTRSPLPPIRPIKNKDRKDAVFGKHIIEKIDAWRYFKVRKLSKYFSINYYEVKAFIQTLEELEYVIKSHPRTRRGQLWVKSGEFEGEVPSEIMVKVFWILIKT